MAKPRVLIVDDDTDILMMLELYFQRAGAEVTTENFPGNALDTFVARKAAAQPFDMVILDIRMPMMNGNELSKSIRASGFTGAIVAFTSSASGEGRRNSKEAGITTYLSKQTLSDAVVSALLHEHCGKAK